MVEEDADMRFDRDAVEEEVKRMLLGNRKESRADRRAKMDLLRVDVDSFEEFAFDIASGGLEESKYIEDTRIESPGEKKAAQVPNSAVHCAPHGMDERFLRAISPSKSVSLLSKSFSSQRSSPITGARSSPVYINSAPMSPRTPSTVEHLQAENRALRLEIANLGSAFRREMAQSFGALHNENDQLRSVVERLELELQALRDVYLGTQIVASSVLSPQGVDSGGMSQRARNNLTHIVDEIIETTTAEMTLWSNAGRFPNGSRALRRSAHS